MKFGTRQEPTYFMDIYGNNRLELERINLMYAEYSYNAILEYDNGDERYGYSYSTFLHISVRERKEMVRVLGLKEIEGTKKRCWGID